MNNYIIYVYTCKWGSVKLSTFIKIFDVRRKQVVNFIAQCGGAEQFRGTNHIAKTYVEVSITRAPKAQITVAIGK